MLQYAYAEITILLGGKAAPKERVGGFVASLDDGSFKYVEGVSEDQRQALMGEKVVRMIKYHPDLDTCEIVYPKELMANNALFSMLE